MENSLNINNASSVGRYFQETQAIPAGGIYTMQQPFNFFRVLDVTGSGSADDLQYYFGGNSSATPVKLGLGVRFETIMPYVRIQNTSNSTLYVTFGLAVGIVFDDRLVGNITVSNTAATALYTQNTDTTALYTQEKKYTKGTGSVVSVPANGNVSITASSHRRVLINNKDSSSALQLFYSGGPDLQPGGTYDDSLTSNFNVYNATASAINLAVQYFD